MENTILQLNISNPFTSLAFLPPDEAAQLEYYRYSVIATIGAFTWNALLNIPTYLDMLFSRRVNLLTMTYFVSIIATAVFIVGCAVFHVGTNPNCEAIAQWLGIGYVVAIPSTSLLFLLRIVAVYNNNRPILGTFVFLWIGVLACSVTLPFSTTGTHIGPTRNCIVSHVKPFISAPIVASTVFDTLVFFSISWRLAYNHNCKFATTFGEGLRTFFKGGSLPAISKAVLKTGQLYYAVTVCSNIANTVAILSPSVPPILHAILLVPNAALTNAMACKVFQDVRNINEKSGGVIWQIPNTNPGTPSSSGSAAKMTLGSEDNLKMEIDSQPRTLVNYAA